MFLRYNGNGVDIARSLVVSGIERCRRALDRVLPPAKGVFGKRRARGHERGGCGEDEEVQDTRERDDG